ncbi:MAG: enoyl-CoA hydratase/isomerase family protein [Leptospiraceae bacterium]|nr:enoyl-CoA hydratase/isomerase family protein [Leptospiraceae bacterium]MCP5500532.1 enoyl-CoA hydratase/isomerase family protein [Leptospiraceae bacterium]
MALVDIETVEVYNDKILILRLNNPGTRNSMTWEMGEAFHEAIENIRNAELPRCLIITGANNVFSSGGDMKLLRSFQEKTLEENRETMFKFYNFFLGIRNLPCPVIGAINGHAIGAAFSLALACDFRIFAEDAKYAFNFVKLGIHPGMGASYFTKELFGSSRAAYLLMLGEMISGKEAFKHSICLDAVPSNEVLKRSMELAIEISENAPLAMQELKKNLYDWDTLQNALKKEAESQAKNYLSLDFAEALKSIEEKRKAVFKGK